MTAKRQYWSRFLIILLFVGFNNSYSNTIFELNESTEVLPPTIVSSPVKSITQNTAIGGGEITSDGGSPITSKGICWSTAAKPTIANNFVVISGSANIFTGTITGLIANTIYHVRAYATNSNGTSYGNDITFTTSNSPDTFPIFTTIAISSVTQNSASSGGVITEDRGSPIFEKGVCWSTNPNPLSTDAHTTQGAGIGKYTSVLSALTSGTLYYVRAYATNVLGTSYGNQISFTTTSDQLPTITTTSASSITQTTAVSGGNITSDGGFPITVRGVCWSINTNPTLANNVTINGGGDGSFVSNLTALAPGITYYVRVYATNANGTAYGNEITFTTSPVVSQLPTVTTTAITVITATSATSGGNVTSDGGATVTIRGICWSTTPNPTLANSFTSDGSGIGTFISNLTALATGITYYVRAYATNTNGTAYGNEITFTTSPVVSQLPTVITTAITVITTTSATSGGNVTSDGGSAVTVRGICWSTTSNPTLANNVNTNGSGMGTFISNLSGLNPGVTYYVRAYATNGVGTAYGNEVTFTTAAVVNQLPTVTTTVVSAITTTTATSGGNVTADGGAAVIARGICWSTTANPTLANSFTSDGSGIGTFISNLTGLSAGVTYYVRAYATNGVGTAYGSVLSFTSTAGIIACANVNDVDGNTYNGVTIGTQCWTQTNLNVSKYRNGDVIPQVTDPTQWSNLTTGAWCYYNNDASNGPIYGKLYNCYAVTDPRGLAPQGWHIPSNSEKNTLVTFLGGPSVAGGKMKEAGTTHWLDSNTATNSSGFTGLPGGNRGSLGNTNNSIGYYGTWWTTTEGGFDYTAINFSLSMNDNISSNTLDKRNGFSIRCIKDLPPQLSTVITTSVSGITANTGFSGGTVTSDGGASVTARGICWSTTSNPTIANNITSDGSGIGTFISNLTGLNPGVSYYVRAYATNSVGTAYGNEVTFTTLAVVNQLPTVITTPISAITSTTATSGGNVSSDGGATVTARGICWSTSPNPTTDNNTTSNGSGIGTFISNLTGLSAGITYYLKAYATNGVGTEYGNEVTFTAAAVVTQLPTVITTPMSTITTTTAIGGGNITSDGGSPVTVRGICWGTTTNPTLANSFTSDGSGTGTFISNLTGLNPGVTHYVRAYATNSIGTAYGNELIFLTIALQPPTIITTLVTSITSITAASGGTISSDGGSPITARGICWSTSPLPNLSNSITTNGIGIGNYISNLSSLICGTTYYVRAYATNAIGTAYGNQHSFITTSTVATCGLMKDIDGNSYNSINIGTQCWTQKNLDVTRYRNGDIIPQITDQTQWLNATAGAWCYYENNTANGLIYGKLYNWFAVNDPRGLAPEGWHIPTEGESVQLFVTLGNNGNVGPQLMANTPLCNPQYPGINNCSGFSALPGGVRQGSAFLKIGLQANFWTTTRSGLYMARWFEVGCYNEIGFGGWVASGYDFQILGRSIRCIKD